MTPLRIGIAMLVAFLALFIGGCVVFGIGTSESDSPVFTTPTETAP